MFDLEQSIADWRRQMLAAGVKTPVPLDELQIHLREEIEQQMKSGLDGQQAFQVAVEKIGRAPELSREFKKTGSPLDVPAIAMLAANVSFALALICQLISCSPMAFAFVFAPGARLSLPMRVLPLLVFIVTIAATVIGWEYFHKFLPVIPNQQLRRAVGIMGYVGCLLWIRFVVFQLPAGLPESTLESVRSVPLILFLLGSEWTIVALLGGIGHGLGKAARGKIAAVA
jgi:hypothetical protein